jgi:hypothetical protein
LERSWATRWMAPTTEKLSASEVTRRLALTQLLWAESERGWWSRCELTPKFLEVLLNCPVSAAVELRRARLGRQPVVVRLPPAPALRNERE